MKITMVAASLRCGGAERVLQLLARGFSARGHEVTVVTTTWCDDFYDLPKGVQRVRLDLVGRRTHRSVQATSTLGMAVRAIMNLPTLRKTILLSDPDFVISFGDEINVVSLLALVGSGHRLVISEHTDPRRHRTTVGWRLLRRMLYPLAEKLVSVSAGVDEQFRWQKKEKRAVIHNPVDIEAIKTESCLPQRDVAPTPFIVGMGRLVWDKGFDLLLRAFEKLDPRFDQWSLVILGEGNQIENLQRHCEKLDLSERVHFPGTLKNPFVVLKQAEFFVLPSRWEGFGNVLVEAMTCGLPTVAFSCPSGPDEIVIDGSTGILVPPGEVEHLASSMERLMKDEVFRHAMGVNASEAAMRWDLPKIVEEWELKVLN